MERIAKIFRNGASQAVRLPKEFQVPGREVIVKGFAGMVILVPKIYRKSELVAALAEIGPVKLGARAQPRRARRRAR
jgi:antitoxin VapB